MSRLLAAYADSSSSSEEEEAVIEENSPKRKRSLSPIPAPLPITMSKRDRALFENDNFKSISAEDLRANDWQDKVLEKIRSKPTPPVSTGIAASKTQKQKHHVNYLAEEAREKEAHLLEKNAAGRSKQRDTRQKYGW
jgi:Mitotic checkpoint regulator, MAD2B-interacting